jgi:ribosomal protein L24
MQRKNFPEEGCCYCVGKVKNVKKRFDKIPVESCRVREGKKRSIQDRRGIGEGGPRIHARNLRHI